MKRYLYRQTPYQFTVTLLRSIINDTITNSFAHSYECVLVQVMNHPEGFAVPLKQTKLSIIFDFHPTGRRPRTSHDGRPSQRPRGFCETAHRERRVDAQMDDDITIGGIV